MTAAHCADSSGTGISAACASSRSLPASAGSWHRRSSRSNPGWDAADGAWVRVEGGWFVTDNVTLVGTDDGIDFVAGSGANVAGTLTLAEMFLERSPAALAAIQTALADKNLPMLAKEAMRQQRLLVNNPCPIDESDARRLYEAAW